MIRLRPLIYIALSPFFGGMGRRILARLILRAHISSSASIGVCYVDADHIVLGPGSYLGHLSIIRNLDSLELQSAARIGTFNWIFGARGSESFSSRKERKSSLILREGASILSRHILDCTDTIEIGMFSTIAGYRSQILTHAINVEDNAQDCAPVLIGPYSFIGTGVVILKGAHFPAQSVLAAGSVYSAREGEPGKIYGGMPAKPVRSLPGDAKYMNREDPRVS